MVTLCLRNYVYWTQAPVVKGNSLS